MMRHARIALLGIAALTFAGAAFAQGTAQMWYIGPFQGPVTIKDGQTPGTPGYYYHPQATQGPTFSERYDHPIRCGQCGHWRDMGANCPWCGSAANRYEQSQARQGAVYSPRPIPGQYWNKRPMRSTTGPKQGIGWPYVNNQYW